MQTWRATLLFLALLPACDTRTSAHVVITFGEFTYHAFLNNTNNVEQYRWETPFEVAFVDFDAIDFRGDIRLEVLDDHDVEVYDRTFVGEGGDLLVFDETAAGDPGEWIIILTTTDADGDVFIRLH